MITVHWITEVFLIVADCGLLIFAAILRHWVDALQNEKARLHCEKANLDRSLGSLARRNSALIAERDELTEQNEILQEQRGYWFVKCQDLFELQTAAIDTLNGVGAINDEENEA